MAIPCLGLRASGFGFQVSSFGCRVSGFGFWAPGFGIRVAAITLPTCTCSRPPVVAPKFDLCFEGISDLCFDGIFIILVVYCSGGVSIDEGSGFIAQG